MGDQKIDTYFPHLAYNIKSLIIACINTYLKLYLLKIVNIEDRVSNHETFKLLSETLIAHNRTF